MTASASCGTRGWAPSSDLLTKDEDDPNVRFDIDLLTRQLVAVTRWLAEEPSVEVGPPIAAIVSRGGRPDLAAADLKRVEAPTLLLVGARDELVLEPNQQAYQKLRGRKALEIMPGARVARSA